MIYTQDTGRPLTNNEHDFNVQQLALRLGVPGEVLLRSDKGAPLTNREVDANFESLAEHTGEDVPIILRRGKSGPLTAAEWDANIAALDAAVNRKLYGEGPYPVMDYVSAGARWLDPRFTFSRPDPSTWIDDDGVLRTAAIDVPVFEAGAWRMEPGATNLVPHSNNLSAFWQLRSSAGVNPTAEMSDIPDPTGKGMAWLVKLAPVASSEWSAVFGQQIYTIPGGVANQPFWIRAKDASNVGKKINCWLHDGAYHSVPTFTLTMDWQRVNITHTGLVTTARNMDYGVGKARSTAGGLLQGSDVATEFLLYGLQLSADGLTSYIPTTTAPATRRADSASIVGPSFAELFNPSEGAWLFDFSAGDYTSGSAPFNLSDGGYANIIAPQYEGSGVRWLAVKEGNLVSTGGLNGDVSAGIKCGFSYSASAGFAAFVNGQKVGTLGYADLPLSALSSFKIPHYIDSGWQMHRRFSVFRQWPSDARMIEMLS